MRRPRHVHVVGEDGERGHGEERVGRVRHPLPLGRGRAARAGRRQRRSGRRRRGRRPGEVERDLDLVVVELLLVLVVLLAERVGQTERRGYGWVRRLRASSQASTLSYLLTEDVSS